MKRILGGALLVAAAVACGSPAPAPQVPSSPSGAIDRQQKLAPLPEPSCDRSAPATCGSHPTYAIDAAPIFATRCVPCHAPGGEAADEHDFSKADVARAQRKWIVGKVSTCAMPPSDAPSSLTPDEAKRLLEWAACGD